MQLPQEISIVIPGPQGDLEAKITEQESGHLATGVICHPHPLMGGTMDNKVVTTVLRAFRDLQLNTVRFNFRGVGKSQGAYDEGRGEASDAVAVLKWAKARFPERKIYLAGFSFGAYVAYKTAALFPVDHLITLAPPVNHFDFSMLQRPACPWALIQGGLDDVVPAEEVLSWASSFSSPPEITLWPDATHFFHGKLLELRQKIIEILGVKL